MATPRQFTLSWQGRLIFVRRQRTSQITLRLRPDGSLGLTAPLAYSKHQIETFVASHHDLIADLIARGAARHDPQSAAYRDAYGQLRPQDEIPVWGQLFSVAWEPAQPPTDSFAEKPLTSVTAAGGRAGLAWDKDERQIILWGEAAQPEPTAQKLREQLIRRLLKEELAWATRARLGQVQERLGVKIAHVGYRSMVSRWGSCRYETGRITLNLDLATHSGAALDMVFWHEACHLVHPNHSPQFKALLGSVYPDWQEVSRQLDYEGMRLS